MFRYVFEDGAIIIARKLSAHEIKVQERNHGKMVLRQYA